MAKPGAVHQPVAVVSGSAMGGVRGSHSHEGSLGVRLPAPAWFHSGMDVEPARSEDVEALVPLMHDYCVFYEVEPRDEGLANMARALIAAPEDEGILLVARDEEGSPVAFAAVGWKWSSLRAARVAVLEDLFVSPAARRGGIGRALIDGCAERARAHGAPCLQWTTAVDNRAAQSVYDAAGARGELWMEYELEL
jgi:GNAT superfamily N-acetyltransferase